ncbi:hypothetical protein PVA44_02535 [Entomospira nematocerorum]|uniref:Uncharacterized protein n=1 Tax=Entomospira nematocerorum TaxID=2719987 RepID=A0A968KUB3_9SPIO|nr:hypothetical protein [Entomospira nematocera]NIZ47089.1 hypothetical protein [Entomospira nematocera]WDI34366.1 hypothetical protein PVA44_02535 [Entomospira nematocera]
MRKTIDVLILLLFVLHYFFFPVRLSKEHFFVLNNAMHIGKTSIASHDNANHLIPFELSGSLGYIDSHFQLRSKISIEDRLAIDSQRYVAYRSESINNAVYDYTGEFLFNINSEGVPLLFENEIYFINSPAGEIEHYDSFGNLVWSYHLGSFISAFDAHKDQVAVGDMNGRLTVLNELGDSIGVYNAPGSAYEGIYGVKLSPSGKYIGVIGGIKPQKFIFFRRGTNGYTPVVHEPMEEIRRTVSIFFDKDEKFSYYEGKNKFFIFHIADNIKESIIKEIPLGKLHLDAFIPNFSDNFFVLLAREDDQQRLLIFTRDGEYMIADISFMADEKLRLASRENSLLMGIDQTIMEVQWQ